MAESRRATDEALKPRSARLPRCARKWSLLAVAMAAPVLASQAEKSSRSRRYAASVLTAAPRSAASMSRNRSISRESNGREPIGRAASTMLGQLVLGHRDDDFARLGGHQGRQG